MQTPMKMVSRTLKKFKLMVQTPTMQTPMKMDSLMVKKYRRTEPTHWRMTLITMDLMTQLKSMPEPIQQMRLISH